VIEDDQYQNDKKGVTFQETLQEKLNKKWVTISMDVFNLTVTVIMQLIYVWRSFDMCYFDKKPIWVLEEQEECNGEAEGWYYTLVIVTHVYFLLEFILRVLIQKYQVKFLTSNESFVEIFTTVPLLISLSVDKRSYIS